MKFIVSSSALLKQLQQISGVINANTVLPILEDFLFEIEKNKLTVVATDLETVMKVHLDIEAKDSGKVCIPAKILMDSLKNIPEQPLTFNIDKNFGVEITSDNGKYKVMGENPDNFPKEPAADDANDREYQSHHSAAPLLEHHEQDCEENQRHEDLGKYLSADAVSCRLHDEAAAQYGDQNQVLVPVQPRHLHR